MTATNEAADVRAHYAEVQARLRACEQRVRELNAHLVTTRFELVDQRRSVVRAPMRDFPGQSIGMVIGQDVTGSRRVDVMPDPIRAMQAKIDLPGALAQLRQAQVDELRLRPAVEELDREEKRQAKLRLLPSVKRAYERLDRALAAAAKERQGVIEALAAVGEVAPQDANVYGGLTWPELSDAQLAHRREQVRAWTQQGNGNGGS